MKRILVTGGTVFVSRYVANWFVKRGHEVYVLNRGSRPQIPGVKLICSDRHALADKLHGLHFDAVLDVCAYNALDVDHLLNALDSFGDYILISSSAVYPENNPRPFTETQAVGANNIWGAYGTDKINAEQTLTNRVSQAYILRPPYLYGPMQNVYREPFVFECALNDRNFYIPRDGSMQLQFFHVADLCKVIEAILLKHPAEHILNVGNPETVSISDFVKMCYAVAGKVPQLIHVNEDIPQRTYFSFHNYEYKLDVSRQTSLLPDTIPLQHGLEESFAWYAAHPKDVNRKPYLQFIDEHWNKNRL